MTKINVKIKRRFKRYLFGLGVFILLIYLAWFFGLKLFGNLGSGGVDAGSGSDGDKRDNVVSNQFKSVEDYPVMIMFDNSPEARPYHAGLQAALVVYETLVEGGATRLAALYAGGSDLKKIGPVRSARPYFVEVAAGWSAFYWHAGGSPEGLSLIKKAQVIDLNEISGLGPRYFWRDNNISRPHNLFTSGELVGLGIADFELALLPEEKLTWQWGDLDRDRSESVLAGNIYVDFSEGILYDPFYKYNDQDKLYYRNQGGLAHRDSVSGEQLGAANVIIQRIPAEKYYPSGFDRLDLEMIGEGNMILFRDGLEIPGRWRKDSLDSQTEWLDLEGNILRLKPGATWVEIVPGERAVTYD